MCHVAIYCAASDCEYCFLYTIDADNASDQVEYERKRPTALKIQHGIS